MTRWLVAAVLLAGCPKPENKPPPPPPVGTTCDSLRPKLEQLYRAEAQQKEPKRVEEAVADNTQMVLNDCAKQPGRVIACVDRARTLAEIEASCVVPLDDEGTETEALKK
jgi:hypothetical protein